MLFKLLICLFPDLNVGKFNHRFDENPNKRNIYNLNAGWYSISITDANGCITRDSINIISNSTPFLIGISTSYIGVDSNITLNANLLSSGSGGNPTTYIWSTGDAGPSIMPLSNGQYWVIATDANGCISDTAFYFVSSFPIISDIIDLDNTLKIYPNPTKGEINVLAEEGIESIQILNNIGEIIYSEGAEKNVQKQYKINISENASGIYIIRLKINNQIINHKIILQ